jgi:HxlR-like helix-turn-helix protein
VDSDSANHSEDQQNGGNGEKHVHLRIGFPDVPRALELGPAVRSRPDVRIQTTGRSLRKQKRWSRALLILRDAVLGIERFEEFQNSLGIATNLLSNRLKLLCEEGVLERVPDEERPGRPKTRRDRAPTRARRAPQIRSAVSDARQVIPGANHIRRGAVAIGLTSPPKE